ncbi:MAG: ABC transporter substrate-binding protein [Gammaproteobacteria bacterium]|nr:ABC transporter substrate-binding protein [Gammaproteobacteria bacterium]MDH3466719.1 ABC transporter substrate-binding protein [Gammaproteobacteria bacterium]
MITKQSKKDLLKDLNRRQFLQTSGALGLAAATSSIAEIVYAQDKTILKIRAYADMRSLDPAFSQGITDEEIHSCIYSKLIQYKPGREWSWELDAAESIEQVDDTHIKFKLKPGIMFTGGHGEMTAEDVKYSYERILDDALESTNKPDWGSLKEVTVDGKYEGTIVFDEPYPPAWNIALPYIVGNIISKKAWEEAGGKVDTTTPSTSGPYLHKEWQPKQKTILVRNPDWHGGTAAFDEIHIFPIDDENTAQIAFESGDIDCTRLSLGAVGNLKASPPENSTIEEYPSLYYVWVGMNVENEAMADQNLRKAVQHCIDVPSILQASYFGAAEASTGIIAPGLIGHRPQSMVPPESDIAKAKEYLAAAGLDGGVNVTLDVLNKAANVTTAQVIQATCAEAGISVEVNLHESGAFWSLGDSSAGERYKDIQLILNRFSMAPDPSYATAWFVSDQKGIWNWERYSDQEFDNLEAKAKATSDPAQRDEMYRKMQDMMEESGAYRFITHEATPVIYRNTIKPAFRPDGLPLLRSFTGA